MLGFVNLAIQLQQLHTYLVIERIKEKYKKTVYAFYSPKLQLTISKWYTILFQKKPIVTLIIFKWKKINIPTTAFERKKTHYFNSKLKKKSSHMEEQKKISHNFIINISYVLFYEYQTIKIKMPIQAQDYSFIHLLFKVQHFTCLSLDIILSSIVWKWI